MTVLARILTVVGIAVVAYVVFIAKPREVFIQEPAPQVEMPKPQQARARPRPQPKPRPAEDVTFEPENTQSQTPTYRPLQAQPAQARRVRKAPSVYKWEESFNSAMAETDPSKRRELIDVAQTAINRRLEEIKLNPGDDSPEERIVIRNAQLGLNLLREEVSNGQSRR